MAGRLIYIALFILTTLIACNNSNTYKAYCSAIEQTRANKNTSIIKDGILPEEDYNGFKGLQYFDVDTLYRVLASVKPMQGNMVEMYTNSEEKAIYYAVFELNFTLKDSNCTLTAYSKTPLHPNQLFIPFKDLSNTNTTYGAGRYIDLDYNDANPIVLDFNLAYNPYCHYNSLYICPVVPLNNHLKLHIYAGEKRLHQ
jgi:uncharacterized protein (DUF1684 family)